MHVERHDAVYAVHVERHDAVYGHGTQDAVYGHSRQDALYAHGTQALKASRQAFRTHGAVGGAVPKVNK